MKKINAIILLLAISFAVFGFSKFNKKAEIGLKKDAWLEVIKKDGLIWDYHVCDFGGWNSIAAAQYGVNSIPTNFLLDANGVIVAKALRGADLEKELDKLVKK